MRLPAFRFLFCSESMCSRSMMVMEAGATAGHIRRDHALSDDVADDVANGFLQNSGADASRERWRLVCSLDCANGTGPKWPARWQGSA
jgi:hypothetical protein